MGNRVGKISRRKPKDQADYIIRNNLALGVPRHGNKNDGKIHSISTAKSYQESLTLAARWLQETGQMTALRHITTDQAQAYLVYRSECDLGQKTLDRDYRVLKMIPSVESDKLIRMNTESLSDGRLAKQSRAYTQEQRNLVYRGLTDRETLCAEIIHAAGLRAVEMLTIKPLSEQTPSQHRIWTEHRFMGMKNIVRYSVIGKGGLIREVALPAYLAEKLDAHRRDQPVQRKDRGTNYQSYYALPGGHELSKHWGKASKREMGWSNGIHGLRHNYAQARMDSLQGSGFLYDAALAIVSQEMGHFRPDITEVYLR